MRKLGKGSEPMIHIHIYIYTRIYICVCLFWMVLLHAFVLFGFFLNICKWTRNGNL
jgi:hypothetical protein